MKQTTNFQRASDGSGALPGASSHNTLNDLYMILESVRAEYETYEWANWRMDCDDRAIANTYWIARNNYESGWQPADETNDDGSPSLPGYGRPLREARTWTGHPLRDAQNAPLIRLSRQGLEIVALANDILLSSLPDYDCLTRRERQTAIVAAVSEAGDLLGRDREAALARLADKISYKEFGRGRLERRRHQLDWLLDGMSPEVIFCRHCGAIFGANDPLDALELELHRPGPARLSPSFSAHAACRAADEKDPPWWR